MGFDLNGVKLLAVARARGALFTRCATLGRHALFGQNAAELAQTLTSLGVPTHDDAARAMLENTWSEPLLEHLGAREITSIDNSSYEGATRVHDLNVPIPDEMKGRFSIVIDGGTLEHVFNFPVAIKSAMELLEVGGHYVGMTPVNNFMGHGLYQFSPELYYRVFSAENGFEIDLMVLSENFGSAWYEVVDPKQVNHRVQLKNTYPTNLFLVAKRTANKVPFAAPPQQSDYVTRWRGGQTAASQGPGPIATAVENAQGALQRDFRLFRIAYRMAMPLYALTSPRMRSGVFRRTSAEALARHA